MITLEDYNKIENYLDNYVSFVIEDPCMKTNHLQVEVFEYNQYVKNSGFIIWVKSLQYNPPIQIIVETCDEDSDKFYEISVYIDYSNDSGSVSNEVINICNIDIYTPCFLRDYNTFGRWYYDLTYNIMCKILDIIKTNNI